MSDGKKKLSFLTVISTIICVVFVCEAAAPAAAIGNQQFFWWIFLILTFLLPYGMVVAELGTTYDGEGGIYDWVRDGLGDKWGARISYYYWVNYPLWIASLATMFPDILGMVFGVEFNLIAKMGIELAFVWIVYLMGRSKAADMSFAKPFSMAYQMPRAPTITATATLIMAPPLRTHSESAALERPIR